MTRLPQTRDDTDTRPAPIADGRACIDHRIQHTADRLIAALGAYQGRFDRVSIAGGAGNFTQTRVHAELSIRLHSARTLVLTAHEDCGAGVTRDDLTRALALARGSYLDVQVRGFWIFLDGNWEEFPL